MNSSFNEDVDPYLKLIINEDLYFVQEKGMIYESKQDIIPTEKEISIPLPDPIETPVEPVKRYKVAIAAENLEEVKVNTDFLTKLLKAIGISWEETTVITAQTNEVSNIESFLIFGSIAKEYLSINQPISLNQPITLGKNKIILTYPLPEFDNNNEKKSLFWKALQNGYSIKK